MTTPTPTPEQGAITRLLRAAHDGDRAAFDEVYRIVYDELRRLARSIRARHGSVTLNTTALVHESYLKLVPGPARPMHDRAHFFAIAARAMRYILVDAARRQSAGKRGAGAHIVSLQGSAAEPALTADAAAISPDDILALNQALEQLQQWSPRQANVVECRVFAGLSIPETAVALNVSEPTVKRDWHTARAWLAAALGG